jgi:AmmeMemoRadiSam system protein A/AmmeMemoRadiSam system protein B
MSIIGGVVVPHPPLIVPSVGKGKEKEIINTINSYKEVAKLVKEVEPDTIIMISPHSRSYSDYITIEDGDGASGDLKDFGAPFEKINVSYDKELLKILYEDLRNIDFPAGSDNKNSDLDHAIMVPLYFINQEYKDYKLIRISISGLSLLDHYKLGMYIQKASTLLDKKIFVVASGDLSHKLKKDGPYGISDEGPLYDEKIMNDLSTGNFLNIINYKEDFLEKAAICGHRGFCIMGGIFDGYKLSVKRLSYEGPFGVGYGICTYKVIGEDDNTHYFDIWKNNKLKEIKEKDEDLYIRLAREAINNYINNHILMDIPDYVSEDMINSKAGVFVSIHKEGKLRGCIGTIKSTQDSIASEIIHNAISAAIRDYRFEPITKDELDELDINVDVLSDSEPIESKDELDVRKYGVIVYNSSKRGLLLPNLDGVDTVEEQIQIALNKAGITKDEEFSMERFEVIRHE